jgi:hypothetical protein
MSPEVQASIIIVAGQWSETIAKINKRQGSKKPYTDLLKSNFNAIYNALYEKFDSKLPSHTL